MVFKWIEGTPFAGHDSQIVGERIEELRASTKRKDIRPIDLVVDAENRRSPLHDMFEWNDKKAAHTYRLRQAQRILASIVVYHSGIKNDARYYANVRTSESNSKSYMPMTVALSEPTLREQLLGESLRDMNVFKNRYQRLKELAQVIEVINKTQPKIRKKVEIF